MILVGVKGLKETKILLQLQQHGGGGTSTRGRGQINNFYYHAIELVSRQCVVNPYQHVLVCL
jgi:hypothetical protein